jgi:hypothetical protein
MGFNTVVFICNDNLGQISKAPQSVKDLLVSPPMGESSKKRMESPEYRRQVAERFDEPILFSDALEVLPTFHADETKFLRAGQNCIVELKFVKYGKTKEGKRTVTLELPDWDK